MLMALVESIDQINKRVVSLKYKLDWNESIPQVLGEGAPNHLGSKLPIYIYIYIYIPFVMEHI
jgi:hypothetical protein